MSSSSALPLKVPSTPAKNNENEKEKTPLASSKQNTSMSGLKSGSGSGPGGSLVPSDISSPHELTVFVEMLLEQLDTKFDEMSKQILDRMSQMSTRVDALEVSIQDIINGDINVPQSPSPIPSTPSNNIIRRSDSGSTTTQ